MTARLSLSRTALVAALAIAGACGRPRVPSTSVAVSAALTRFETEIRAFEDSDRVKPPAPNGIVFVGSSSIRLWPDLRADFPGRNVIQRGFGGSRLDEVLYYAPRMVLPYKPQLIVLYTGENDVAEGRTPTQIFSDYKSFVALVQRHLSAALIAYISIKPSPSRWQLVDRMRETNSMIERYALTHPQLAYIDVFTPMIGPSGRPRAELFVSDSLHMNRDGYALWRRLLTPWLVTKVY